MTGSMGCSIDLCALLCFAVLLQANAVRTVTGSVASRPAYSIPSDVELPSGPPPPPPPPPPPTSSAAVPASPPVRLTLAQLSARLSITIGTDSEWLQNTPPAVSAMQTDVCTQVLSAAPASTCVVDATTFSGTVTFLDVILVAGGPQQVAALASALRLLQQNPLTPFTAAFISTYRCRFIFLKVLQMPAGTTTAGAPPSVYPPPTGAATSPIQPIPPLALSQPSPRPFRSVPSPSRPDPPPSRPYSPPQPLHFAAPPPYYSPQWPSYPHAPPRRPPSPPSPGASSVPSAPPYPAHPGTSHPPNYTPSPAYPPGYYTMSPAHYAAPPHYAPTFPRAPTFSWLPALPAYPAYPSKLQPPLHPVSQQPPPYPPFYSQPPHYEPQPVYSASPEFHYPPPYAPPPPSYLIYPAAPCVRPSPNYAFPPPHMPYPPALPQYPSYPPPYSPARGQPPLYISYPPSYSPARGQPPLYISYPPPYSPARGQPPLYISYPPPYSPARSRPPLYISYPPPYSPARGQPPLYISYPPPYSPARGRPPFYPMFPPSYAPPYPPPTLSTPPTIPNLAPHRPPRVPSAPLARYPPPRQYMPSDWKPHAPWPPTAMPRPRPSPAHPPALPSPAQHSDPPLPLPPPFIADGALRLVGGATQLAGRLEIYHSGQWGGVCGAHGFDLVAANVACRQLGYTSGYPLPAGAFGTCPGQYWLSAVLCEGNEEQLASCLFTKWSPATTGCHADQAAAVTCIATAQTVRLAPQPSPCPAGQPTQYALLLNVLTWSQAEAVAQELGGHVAALEGQAEVDHLIPQLLLMTFMSQAPLWISFGGLFPSGGLQGYCQLLQFRTMVAGPIGLPMQAAPCSYALQALIKFPGTTVCDSPATLPSPRHEQTPSSAPQGVSPHATSPAAGPASSPAWPPFPDLDVLPLQPQVSGLPDMPPAAPPNSDPTPTGRRRLT